jgi:hypothetical protein
MLLKRKAARWENPCKQDNHNPMHMSRVDLLWNLERDRLNTWRVQLLTASHLGMVRFASQVASE